MAIIHQTKKEKKITESPSLLVLSDDIMSDIVARLPLKSLFICKSVCKTWLSIISQQEFIKLYMNQWKRGSRILLSIRDQGHQRYLLRTSTSTNNNSNNSVDFEEWLSLPFTKCDGVTQVINGLFCFYKGCHVWICNLSTGESMKLPSSRFDNDKNAHNLRYFFGFDPISAAYKLLKVDKSSYECEILTIGDMSWKFTNKFGPRPHYSYYSYGSFPAEAKMDEAFCVDGSLHWPQGKIGVISFHLNQQHFYINCFMDKHIVGPVLQFKGCLALAYKTIVSHHLNIVIKKENRWTNHTFELPIQHNLIPLSCFPTGEIILVDAEYSDHCIYSFDPESHKFDRFVVGKLPKSKLDSSACISCFQPNFNPLSLILKLKRGL